MKYLLFFISLLVTSMSYSQYSSATLTASGLTCSMCSKAVYEALNHVSFVDQVKANIQESSYTVTFKENQDASLDVLRKAVENAGFSVARLQVTAVFKDANIDNDVMIKLGKENLHFLHVSPQTLNGNVTFTILDSKFTTDKLHRQYAKYTTMQCYQSGIAKACCAKTFGEGARIYHITL